MSSFTTQWFSLFWEHESIEFGQYSINSPSLDSDTPSPSWRFNRVCELGIENKGRPYPVRNKRVWFCTISNSSMLQIMKQCYRASLDCPVADRKIHQERSEAPEKNEIAEDLSKREREPRIGLNRLELRCCGLRENRRYYHSGDWRPTRFMWDHPIKFFLNQPGQQCTRTLFWAFNRLFVSRILLCFFTKKHCWNLKGFLVGKWKCIQIFNPSSANREARLSRHAKWMCWTKHIELPENHRDEASLRLRVEMSKVITRLIVLYTAYLHLLINWKQL